MRKRAPNGPRSVRYGWRIAALLAAAVFAASLTKRTLADDGIGPDPNFGVGGRVLTEFFGESAEANDVAIQSDGKIVACGWVYHGGTRDFALARYNPSGSLDESFGSGGLVRTDFFGSDDVAEGVVIQADGKIIAVGWATVSTNSTDFALARYNANGTLDHTFGLVGGRVTEHYSNNDKLTSVALQSTGRIVAVGYTDNAPHGKDFVLLRYLTDGLIDNSFGASGTAMVLSDFGNTDQEASDLAIENGSDRIAVSGTHLPIASNAPLIVAMYGPNGGLETSFGDAGKRIIVEIDGYYYFSQGKGISFDLQGNIVACGATITTNDLAAGAVLTLNPVTGATVRDYEVIGVNTLVAVDTVSLPVGTRRALFSDRGSSSDWDFFVQEVDSDGLPSGHSTTTDFFDRWDDPTAIAAYGFDKAVAVGGSFSSTAHGRFAVARYVSSDNQTTPNLADLSITMTAAGSAAPTGKYITYTIAVTNAGPATSYYVTVKDVIPTGTTFHKFSGTSGWVSTKPATGATGTVSVSKATLAPGESATFTLMVKVSANVIPGTMVNNTSQVSSPETPESIGSNNSVTTHTPAP